VFGFWLRRFGDGIPREHLGERQPSVSDAMQINRLAIFAVLLMVECPALAKTPTPEQHIQHISAALMPSVLIHGEPAETTSLADRMASLHVIGVSIAVIHEGKLQWARGFGVTSVGGAAVTPSTLFQAASISKPVSALGALSLVQAGKLDLDADVNQYLKSWKIPLNTFTAQHPVTLRELLNHTAGTTVHGFAGYASEAPIPSLVQILDGEAPSISPAIRVDCVPGTAWRYSGGGYVVVQQLLQDVTGKPFARFMQDTVLDRLGMKHSTFSQPLSPKELAQAALPYGSSGAPIGGGPHVYPEMAAAGLWTTPSDLANFAIELQRSLKGRSNRVTSKSMTRQLLTAGLNNWGLGLHVGPGRGSAHFEHDGVNAGYFNDLMAYEDGEGAVIMTNSDNGDSLAQELRRTIAQEYNWPDFRPAMHTVIHVGPERSESLTGSYQLKEDSFVTISREGERLFAQISGQKRREIFAESEREWFAKSGDTVIEFESGETARARKLMLRQGDRTRAASRLDDSAAKAVAEEFLATNQRIHDQVPLANSQATLLQLLSDLSVRRPRYQSMTADFASLMHEQVGQLEILLSKLGTVQSVKFESVMPNGVDEYEVTFANGKARFGMSLNAGGSMSGLGIYEVDRH
jgi:CubicO group peptidase (beta-lactamase class C family)